MNGGLSIERFSVVNVSVFPKLWEFSVILADREVYMEMQRTQENKISFEKEQSRRMTLSDSQDFR